jgi:type I restriction enzyme M protein
MLDNTTKKRIDDCRDILVGKLPDPKSQIEQITIALIYKFMDDMDKESIELGGEAKFFSGGFEKYSWDSLFDTRVTATEMLKLYSEAIESMEKNPNIPQLFRNIFKNAYLPYRDPETLKLFLKTIGEFEYTHSEKLGDAFEYLLSVMGSQGDAGQFRTPRHIIDFLVEAVDPNKTDTILDPACGTAGFLISAFKRIKEKNNNQLTPDERRILIQNFIGYDISPDMVRLSLVNLYLHGFSNPHIFEYDTLTSEERWNDTYDVILANPPFMSPKGGIRPHKRFTVTSNRSEVLFVDYIAEHLNPNGRAGVIVPEGIIFQSGKAYKSLRKMLVENYLYAVVSLPAGVFNPYSGVKTSILLMDKTLAKKTNKILFVKIENDGYNLGAQRNEIKGGQLGDAVEIIKNYKLQINNGEEFENNELAHAVEKAKIAENGDFNLSGERYKEQVIANTKYELFELQELFEIQRGGSPRPINEYITVAENGINWIKIGDVAEGAKYISSTKQKIKPEGLKKSRLVEPGDFILSNSMSYGRPYIVNITGAIHDGWLVFKQKKNNLLKDYIFNILSSQFVKNQFSKSATGGVVKNLNINLVKKVKIPLPPLSIQEDIVAEIEGYQKIIDGAKQVVEYYKPKIDIPARSAQSGGDPDWEMVELGDYCKIKGGNAFKSSDYVDNGVQLIRMGNVKRMFFDWENSPSYLPLNYLEEYPNYIIEKGNLLISMTGTVGKEDYGNVCQIDIEKQFLLNQRVGKFEIRLDKLDNQYLYYITQNEYFRKQLFANSSGGVRQANISNKGIESIKIPLPPLETQKQIVAHIEKEQELVNANKELIKIFEQKIKDSIAKVWGEDKKEETPELSMAANKLSYI